MDVIMSVCVCMCMHTRMAPALARMCIHTRCTQTDLQARVGAHGPQALVPLQRHEQLQAPDEGLVGQRFHACNDIVRWF